MSDVVVRNEPAPQRFFSAVLGSPALRLIGWRLLTAVPILLGVTLLASLLLNLFPGSPAQAMLGIEATPEQIAALNRELGFDRPWIERYLTWLGDVVTGDMGRSLVSRQPVTDVLGERLAVTAQLVGWTFLVALVLSIPIALLAARRPNGFFDKLTLVISSIGLAVPNYVLALVLVLVFAVGAGVLPAIGYVPFTDDPGEYFYFMTLPVMSLALGLFFFYTRFLRNDLVDQMEGQDYVMTARAKGLGRGHVLLRHAFRNSSFGLITFVGLNLSAFLGLTVITESIFSLPGIGNYFLQSIGFRDYVVLQAVVLVFATVTVVCNLIADILYAVLDPRIRYGSNN